MSKKCIVCGSELDDNAVFCDECGVEQKEIAEQQKVGEVNVQPQVEELEQKERRIFTTDKESSLRGFISLVLGIISIIAKNSIFAVIGILLGMTVLFNKRKKKMIAICGILLSILVLFVIIPNNGDESIKEDGVIETINDGVTNVEQMIYGTPIDLFIETTSAFELYEQINLEKNSGGYECDKEYKGYGGKYTVDFYGGYGPEAMQVESAQWYTYQDTKACKEITDELVNNLQKRYGEYEDTYHSELREQSYRWYLEEQIITVTMHNAQSSYVRIAVSNTTEYYADKENTSIPDYTQIDPIVGDCSLGNWVGKYVNENGDIMSIDISYAIENGYDADGLEIILSSKSGEEVKFIAGCDKQVILYFNYEEDMNHIEGTISSDFEKISLVQSGHLSHNYMGVYTRIDNSSESTYEIEFDSLLEKCDNAVKMAEELQELGYEVSYSTLGDTTEYFIKDGVVTWYDGEKGLELYLSSEKYDNFSVYGISTRMSYDEVCEYLEQVLGVEYDGNSVTIDNVREIDIWTGYNHFVIGITNLQATENGFNTIENGDYILEGSSDYLLEWSDLEGLTAEECKIARNEIYARHGRLFTDVELQVYFDSCSWYQGYISSEEFSEDMLSDIEKANRDLIIEYEEEMGYR